MTLDASIGTSTSNSYVTTAEADLYFADRIGGDKWDLLSSKDPYLITASRLIDWNFEFIGIKTDTLQSMKFPRTDLIIMIGNSDSFTFPSDQIPPQVKHATLELAFQSLSSDRTVDNSMDGLSQIQAGPLLVKASPGGSKNTKPEMIPQYIRKILSDIVVGSIGVVRLERA